jgi:CelD/BcsL family acetyltransferase involved in cellulose biosynthesis
MLAPPLSDPCASEPQLAPRYRAQLVPADFTTLAALTPAWSDLADVCGGPIEHPAWHAACAALVGRSASPWLATVHNHDRLEAILPLVTRRRRGVPRLAALGVDEHHEPMDVLHRSVQALEALVAALLQEGLPWELGRVPADTATVEAVQRACRGRAVVVTRTAPAAPYILLDSSWTAPEEHLNAGRRSDLRRARRKAEKFGPLSAEVVLPDESQLDPLLNELFAVEARSWKGRSGTAIALDPAENAFCREYARQALRHGLLRLCYLRLGGRAVAVQMALQHRGAFWLLKIGYDAEYAACSPGLLLLCETISHAAREGLTRYEFLGQEESWIQVWTERAHPCVSLRIYPHTPAGTAALAADAVSYAAKYAARHTARHARLLASRSRAQISKLAAPLLRRAARRYISGPALDDALRTARQLAAQHIACTLGYWDAPQSPPREVADQYLAAIDALTAAGLPGYVSIKLPSLGYSRSLLDELAERALHAGRRLHFDSLAPDSADRTRSLAEALADAYPQLELGYTLAARWQRACDDADWAAARRLHLRVVKGEWPDPHHDPADLRTPFLALIDRLAGKAHHVAVASHDVPLADQALGRLQAAATPSTLELLYGLPMRGSLALAQRKGVTPAVYVPYGEAYAPYALSQALRKPRLLWWLARDIAASALSPILRRS